MTFKRKPLMVRGAAYGAKEMPLPIRTTLEDLDAVCGYLCTKPTGTTRAEAKAVLGQKSLDGRKLAGLKVWGLIEDDGDRMKVTDRGRRAVKDAGASRSGVLQEVVRQIRPYAAVVERVVHRGESIISATEVAAVWHEHFKSDASTSESSLNAQAVCFFQLAQGADLGKLVFGRKGNPTRFDFDEEAGRAFVAGSAVNSYEDSSEEDSNEAIQREVEDSARDISVVADSRRVFITHGKNKKIVDQVKELVTYGKFEPIVATEHETAAKPVPKKVMDDMRTCGAAVIHVSADRALCDKDGNEVRLINENVLIEIGAAMALYRDKFVLLVEAGVILPSNLQGLYECRYSGDELNMPATMKLLKALSDF